MRIGLALPFSGDAPAMVETARQAAAMGYAGVFATDHLFAPGHPDRPTLEPFSLLAAVAAACPGLVIGTLVARVNLRPAAVLAKMAAGLDDLSGGRMIIGLGSGDRLDRPENEAFGVDGPVAPTERLELLGDTGDALRALFRGEAFAGGRSVPAMDGRLAPMPQRPGGPPIWFGGRSEAVVRLAAGRADGWNCWGADVAGFAAGARLLAGTGTEATWAGIVNLGDDADDVRRRIARRRELGLPEVWSGDVTDLRAFLDGLREAGATWAILRMPIERAEVAATVIPELAA